MEQLIELKELIKGKAPQSDIAKMLVSHKKDGLSLSEIRENLSTVMDQLENSLPDEYVDDIDDLIAALEGHCCRSYMLHPEQLENL